MPYDEGLAERLRETVGNQPGMRENHMMGGFGYLLHGNMCVGIHKESLMIRVGVETAEQILQEPHVNPMDFTGKVMKGWATVEPQGLEDGESLARFCQLSIDFVETLPHK